MVNKDAHNESGSICANCHIGNVRRQRITYVQWHDGQCIVVPGVNAEICDYCGNAKLNDDQLWRLDQLLRHGRESVRVAPERYRPALM